jgi:hypothetical protein
MRSSPSFLDKTRVPPLPARPKAAPPSPRAKIAAAPPPTSPAVSFSLVRIDTPPRQSTKSSPEMSPRTLRSPQLFGRRNFLFFENITQPFLFSLFVTQTFSMGIHRVFYTIQVEYLQQTLTSIFVLVFCPAAEKRSRVMHEILSSEETYIQGLERLVDGFMVNIRKLGEKHAPAKQIATVFSNIEQILTFQREFCASLKAAVAVDLLPTAGQAPPLGVVFIRMAPFLKSYAIYASNYATALNVLAEWRSSSTMSNLLEQGRKSYGQDIEFYLILPIQRIPRYELLLRDLLAVTPETNQDYHELTEALKNIKQVADHVNSLVRQHQNSERALALGLKELLAPARRLVADGVYQCEIVGKAPQQEAPTSSRSGSSASSSSRISIQLVYDSYVCSHFVFEPSLT